MSAAIDDAAATERRPVLVDLALQGGGSHGATGGSQINPPVNGPLAFAI